MRIEKIKIGKKIGFWESPNVRNQRPKEQSFEDEEENEVHEIQSKDSYQEMPRKIPSSG